MDCQANRDGSSNDSTPNICNTASSLTVILHFRADPLFSLFVIQAVTLLGVFADTPSIHIAFRDGSRLVTLALLVRSKDLLSAHHSPNMVLYTSFNDIPSKKYTERCVLSVQTYQPSSAILSSPILSTDNSEWQYSRFDASRAKN